MCFLTFVFKKREYLMLYANFFLALNFNHDYVYQGYYAMFLRVYACRMHSSFEQRLFLCAKLLSKRFISHADYYGRYNSVIFVHLSYSSCNISCTETIYLNNVYRRWNWTNLIYSTLDININKKKLRKYCVIE